jgi:hypothetical protein
MAGLVALSNGEKKKSFSEGQPFLANTPPAPPTAVNQAITQELTAAAGHFLGNRLGHCAVTQVNAQANTAATCPCLGIYLGNSLGHCSTKMEIP